MLYMYVLYSFAAGVLCWWITEGVGFFCAPSLAPDGLQWQLEAHSEQKPLRPKTLKKIQVKENIKNDFLPFQRPLLWKIKKNQVDIISIAILT